MNRNAPRIVMQPERFEGSGALGEAWHIRFEQFLMPDVAELLTRSLAEKLSYERVDYCGITRLWRGVREIGDAYFGRLIWTDDPPIEVEECERLFDDPWFLRLLGHLAGGAVRLMRPATPYLLKYGDRICLHDDMSDPDHCLSVVVGLAHNWGKDDGGETIVGQVDRVEDIPTPPEIPFQLRRWHLTNRQSTLIPIFNSLSVIRLSPSLAHGVNPVLSDKNRFSLVALYGWAHI